MSEITPKQGCQFWIYIMSRKVWKEYDKYEEMYLSYYLNTNVRKGDIIFLYLKNKNLNGFVGICKTSTNPKKNNKIKIFKDNNLNNYVLELEDSVGFDPVKLDKVFPHISINVKGYRSIQSFRLNCLVGYDCLSLLEYSGVELLKGLYELTKVPEATEPVESSESENISLKTHNKKRKSNIEVIDLSDSADESDEITYDSELDSSINDSSNDSDYAGESNEGDEEEEEEKEESDGMIPIMVIPCKGFKLPKKDDRKIKYFKEHYLTCNDCDITNNNNVELSVILENSCIEIVNVTKKKDPYYNSPIESYWGLEKYEPMFAEERPFIRVATINNGDEYYDGCLLIAWII
jgi:hypothetical protein